MRRSALLTVAVLGGLVCLLGGTVLYSALQDTARTGTNSVDSAALAASADIQLATATRSGTITCGTFSEDLTSGLFSASGVSPGYESAIEYFCIKNVGSQPVTLSVVTDQLVDVDFACTGDEAVHGDTTCGADQTGELSRVLGIGYATQNCASPGVHSAGTIALVFTTSTPQALGGTLAAGATACFSTRIAYSSTMDPPDVQKAQSDRSTWKIKFTAQA